MFFFKLLSFIFGLCYYFFSSGLISALFGQCVFLLIFAFFVGEVICTILPRNKEVDLGACSSLGFSFCLLSWLFFHVVVVLVVFILFSGFLFRIVFRLIQFFFFLAFCVSYFIFADFF